VRSSPSPKSSGELNGKAGGGAGGSGASPPSTPPSPPSPASPTASAATAPRPNAMVVIELKARAAMTVTDEMSEQSSR